MYLQIAACAHSCRVCPRVKKNLFREECIVSILALKYYEKEKLKMISKLFKTLPWSEMAVVLVGLLASQLEHCTI